MVAGITRQLGKTIKVHDQAGYKYTSKWHVLDADLATYTFDKYADCSVVIATGAFVGDTAILISMTINPSGSFGYDYL
jgi:hypothetical protein